MPLLLFDIDDRLKLVDMAINVDFYWTWPKMCMVDCKNVCVSDFLRALRAYQQPNGMSRPHTYDECMLGDYKGREREWKVCWHRKAYGEETTTTIEAKALFVECFVRLAEKCTHFSASVNTRTSFALQLTLSLCVFSKVLKVQSNGPTKWVAFLRCLTFKSHFW
jgi:hypothetical protein